MTDSLPQDSLEAQDNTPLPVHNDQPIVNSDQPPALPEKNIARRSTSSNRYLIIETVLLILILSLGAYLRFVGLDWDSGQHLHPDERFLTMVGSAISSVKSIGEFFDTPKSSLNPYNKGFGFFVYGTTPIFIVRYVGEGIDALKVFFADNQAIFTTLRPFGAAYDGIYLVGRALSAFFDLITVYIVFLFGTRLYDRRVGLLASALYAFSVIIIQQAHFYTVDSFANTFVALSLYFSARALDETKLRHYVLFGLFFGLSLASKINTAPLALAIVLAGFVVLYRAYQPLTSSPQPTQQDQDSLEKYRNKLTQDILFGLVVAGIVSVIVFRIGQPYAFNGLGFNEAWLKNMGEIRSQVTGDVDFPPNHQWTNRPAFIFPLENMIKWGMGVPLGIIVWIGFAFAAWQSVRGKFDRHLIPVVWSGLYFAWQGSQWVKPMRYFMPIYPTLIVLGAWMLFVIWDRAMHKPDEYETIKTDLDYIDRIGKWILARLPRIPKLIGGAVAVTLITVVVVGTFAWAFAFSRIYTRTVTRLAASQWMQQNIPGPLNLQIETGEGVVNQPISLPNDYIFAPNNPYSASFTAIANGNLQAVYAARALDMERTPTVETFKVQISSDPGGINVLATGAVTADFGKVDQLRGDPFQVKLDQPVALTKGVQYWLIGQADKPVRVSGSIVANESSWDDGLPLRFDNFDPYGGYYKGENFEMYFEDTEQKRQSMFGVLDRADYIAISSNRQYASIPRLPMRYPLTIVYYNALFSGQLGYDLVYENESAPNLGGFVISDQSAEEPFTVYDHPKVYIFKKSPTYSSENVQSILKAVDLSKVVWMNPYQATVAPTVLMLPEDRLAQQRAGGTWSEMFDYESLLNKYEPLGVVVWWLTIVILGWLTFPITFAAFGGLSDRGYTITRNVSLLIIAWGSWILASVRFATFSRLTLWSVTLVVAVISALVAWRRRDEMIKWLRENWRHILISESVALGLFIFFLLVRWGNGDTWHPAYGGEKPMDLSYFNAVIKSSYFPPYDPWLSGGYLNYYYYGFVIVATLTKMLGIVPSFAYNLILPMLFSMVGLGAFGAAYNLVASRWWLATSDQPPDANKNLPSPYIAGFLACAFMVMLGNLGELDVIGKAMLRSAPSDFKPLLAYPYIGDIQRMAAGFWNVYVQGAPVLIGTGEWYWNATRVIPDQGTMPITEFPYFTFLYADLHAHMIVLAMTVIAVSWVVSLVMSAKDKIGWVEFAATWIVGGLTFGVIRPSNLSDYQTYWILACVAITYAEWRRHDRFTFAYLVSVGWRCALLIGLSIILYQPYTAWRGEGYGAADLWTGDKTPLGSYLTVQGLFLFIIFTFLLVETRHWMQRTLVDDVKDLAFTALLGLMGVAVLAFGMWYLGYWIMLIAIPLTVWCGLLMIRPDAEPQRRSALALIGLGLALTMLVEIVVAKGDIGRMNTVFKFYLQVWTFFSIACGAAVAWIFSQMPEWNETSQRVWKTILIVLMLIAFSYTSLATAAKVRDRMVQSAPRTLDGMDYMQYATYADQGQDINLKWDYEAIRWMQNNVKGSPVIVEVNATEYKWGSRYTINTGLPGVLGWNWHQRQQRVVVPSTLVTDRVDAINNFYRTTNPATAQDFLKKYNVSFIVVGGYERAYFPAPESLGKFDVMAEAGVLKVAYTNEGTKIYEVVSRK